MRQLPVWAVLPLPAVVPGCGGEEVTEILVVVDSNLDVPGQMDAVRVEVTASMTASSTGELVGSRARSLPRTVGLVHGGGPLGPIDIRAVGLSAGAEVVERRARTSFVRGKTLVLSMYLSRDCLHVRCGDGQTCRDGACTSADVDPDALPTWNGTVPRIDGGACEAVSERCNSVDDDCDGLVDEGFDLESDPINCGRCMNVCKRPRATVACMDGACVVTGCHEGFGDCNGDDADGCETDLTSADHCGACDNACTFDHATGACADGACAIESCDEGFGDCNADGSDGCEQSLDTVDHCGACGAACTLANATAECTGGVCAITTCDAGFDDCNADETDGCEQSLATLAHCGGCDTPCTVANGTATCATGSCAIDTCDAGFGDCNGDPTDGCETPLNTLDDCGSCGARCDPFRGTGSCDTGVCVVESCDNPDRWGDCNMDASDGCETDLRSDEMHCGACGNACDATESCVLGRCV